MDVKTHQELETEKPCGKLIIFLVTVSRANSVNTGLAGEPGNRTQWCEGPLTTSSSPYFRCFSILCILAIQFLAICVRLYCLWSSLLVLTQVLLLF